MPLSNWLDPNWRRELSNGVILWVTLGVLAGIAGITWLWIRSVAAVSLLGAILLGALIGGMAGALVWTILPRISQRQAESPSIKEQDDAPLYVTGLELLEPFQTGQRLKARLHLFCERSLVVRARGSARFVHLQGGDEDDYQRNRQGIEDEVVWRPFEQGSGLMEPPDSIRLPKGPYSMELEPMTLQPHNVAALQDGTAIVYLAGQIDYGAGALDYCYVWRPGRAVKPCLDHNGSAERRLF